MNRYEKFMSSMTLERFAAIFERSDICPFDLQCEEYSSCMIDEKARTYCRIKWLKQEVESQSSDQQNLISAASQIDSESIQLDNLKDKNQQQIDNKVFEPPKRKRGRPKKEVEE